MAELTTPLTPSEVRTAHAEAQGLSDGTIGTLLRIAERAIRAQYHVSRTDAEADATLGDAILAAWPTFVVQVRNIASESVGTDGASVTYAVPLDLRWPTFLSAMLASVSDYPSASGSIALFRS